MLCFHWVCSRLCRWEYTSYSSVATYVHILQYEVPHIEAEAWHLHIFAPSCLHTFTPWLIHALTLSPSHCGYFTFYRLPAPQVFGDIPGVGPSASQKLLVFVSTGLAVVTLPAMWRAAQKYV